MLALLCHIHSCTYWHAHGSRVCRLDGDDTVDVEMTGKSFHGGLEKFKKGFNYQRLGGKIGGAAMHTLPVACPLTLHVR